MKIGNWFEMDDESVVVLAVVCAVALLIAFGIRSCNEYEAIHSQTTITHKLIVDPATFTTTQPAEQGE